MKATIRIGRAGLLAAVGGGALLTFQPASADTLQEAVAKVDSSTPAVAPLAGTVDTLRDALIRAYSSNPTLTAQRSQLRSVDEGVAIAKSQTRPQLSGTVGFNQDITSTGGGNGRNFTAGVDVSLPLWAGGGIKNSISAAKTRVQAGRADLRAVEGDVFVEAVASFMDVIRDRSIVSLNENQVKVLETNLQATRDRFEVGDLTRTDVAQSEARLSLARSQLATAQGQLTASEENYRRVIGAWPGDLAPPPPLPTLPGTAEQAVDTALANNPDLRSIHEQIRAAGLDVRVARSDRLPTISGVSTTRYTNFLGTADEQFAPGAPNNSTDMGIGLQARVPLYQGGLVGARVRQSQAIQSRLLEQGIAVERSVVATARSAFAAYRASLEAIDSNQAAVEANTLALEGTRAEQSVGTRNVLDVLNAEQELLSSQVELVRARRNAYVAGFQLLNAMGQAEARDLNLDSGPLYDPTVNYRRVVGRIDDWEDDQTPAPVATRTVGPNAPPPPGTKAP